MIINVRKVLDSLKIMVLPSGKHTNNYEKSQLFIGKSTNFLWPCSMSQTVSHYQRATMVLGHVPIDLPKGISPHLATKRSSIFNVRISRFERVPFERNLPRSDCRGAFFSDCEQWEKVGLFETAQRPYARWCFKMDGNSGWAVQVLLFGTSKLDSKASDHHAEVD